MIDVAILLLPNLSKNLMFLAMKWGENAMCAHNIDKEFESYKTHPYRIPRIHCTTYSGKSLSVSNRSAMD